MKREDILEQYRREKIDEGFEHINSISSEYGFLSIMALTAILTIYKTYNNIPYGDVASIPLVYLVFNSFRRYKDTNEGNILIFGIISLLLCIAFLSWYVIKTS